MKNQNNLPLVKASDLSLVENSFLNEKQLKLITTKTPEKYTRTRPGKGGTPWIYVSGAYIKKMLNLAFGWDWDFNVISHQFDINIGQAYVLGRLTIRNGGRTIIKEQFGRVDIKFKALKDEKGNYVKDAKGKNIASTEPLDLGNDLKAATTDALKKCASEIGIAADIYAAEEFKEVEIVEVGQDLETELKDLFNRVEIPNVEEEMNIQRIIDQKEEKSYLKAIKVLRSYER
jgi:hypothetical protein